MLSAGYLSTISHAAVQFKQKLYIPHTEINGESVFFDLPTGGQLTRHFFRNIRNDLIICKHTNSNYLSSTLCIGTIKIKDWFKYILVKCVVFFAHMSWHAR